MCSEVISVMDSRSCHDRSSSGHCNHVIDYVLSMTVLSVAAQYSPRSFLRIRIFLLRTVEVVSYLLLLHL